jgi:hypothetical protein
MHDSLTEDGSTVSWGAIRKFHMTDPHHMWNDIGYHYGIELIGDYYEILQGRMVGEKGAHCLGFNSSSIGICLVGNFEINPVPQAQWQRAVDLVAHLSYLFEIPIGPGRIGGHREFDTTRTCPHKNFDCDKFREAVQVAQTGLLQRKALEHSEYFASDFPTGPKGAA